MSVYKIFIIQLKQDLTEIEVNEKTSEIVFKEINEVIKLMVPELKEHIRLGEFGDTGMSLWCDNKGLYFENWKNDILEFSKIGYPVQKILCKRFPKYIKNLFRKIEKRKISSREDCDNMSESKSEILEMMKDE